MTQYIAFGSLSAADGYCIGGELMGSRTTLTAFNKQIRQLSDDIQHKECGLIELGRMHSRNFDAGHHASGGGVQRVLAELRRLAQREEKAAVKAQAQTPVQPVRSQLDELRARRANADGVTDPAGRIGSAMGD
jgi:hypothetical protein